MINVLTDRFHIVCAVFGIFTFLLTFVSFLVKERLFISDSLLSYLVGAIAGPLLGAMTWAGGAENLETITLNFTRLSLCVQVLLSSIQLPGRFLRDSRRSMLVALLIGMSLTWLISTLLIWAICTVENDTNADGGNHRIAFLHALAIGACVAPTDPVLASTIVKGRWADQHVPAPLAQLISGESGANDGLGYPFVFLALYLTAYVGGGSAMAEFFGNTMGYMLILGAFWGAVIGFISAKALRLFRGLHYVDHESFFAFPIVLVILLIGTCGMAGSNDILAAFILGNVLSWDGWYQLSTAEDSLGPTFDVFLNIALFIYLGAICPWDIFDRGNNDVQVSPWHIPVWKLVCLAIALLALRRLPVMLLLYRMGLLRPHVTNFRQAFLIGFFGPMGISSIFYLHEILHFCRHELSDQDGAMTPEGLELFDVSRQVIWFVVTSSVVVHGVAIPVYQTGTWLWMECKSLKPQERPRADLRGFIDKERNAIKHVLEGIKDDEHRAEEYIETHLPNHPRPRPTFRRVKRA
ncbi:hypothetical protein ACRALDRAFT_1051269 [Sodiomyces alcalophilus JCM 7366]|uniref:uncharacterized protein n=1 Tax=Sodiomyces alcalophilus JCM 7366 TaxID=591952 RepID=UPI0039B63FF9